MTEQMTFPHIPPEHLSRPSQRQNVLPVFSAVY